VKSVVEVMKKKKKEKRCAGQGKLFEEGFTGSELLAKKGTATPPHVTSGLHVTQ